MPARKTKSKPEPKGARQKPDWEAIESQYRAGILSLRAIATQFGIAESYIRKKAKAEGWLRNLADKVSKAAKRKSPKAENAPKASQKAKEGRKPKAAQGRAKSKTKAQTAAPADVASDTPDEAGPATPTEGGYYHHAYAEQARQLCEKGFTDYELARFFKVARGTIYRWKNTYPDFCNALKTGKELADERVERTLYEKATGYTFDSEKIFQFQGNVVRAQTVEHIPPDTTAAIFWLKNRRPEQWRDKHEIGGDLNVTFADRIRAVVARRDARANEEGASG